MGLKARVLYQMPSTAICWTTYEFFKYCMNSNMRVEATALLPAIDVVSTEEVPPLRELAREPLRIHTAPHAGAQPVISSLPALAFNTATVVHHSSHREMHNAALLEGINMPRS
jgi:hypothetical protein